MSKYNQKEKERIEAARRNIQKLQLQVEGEWELLMEEVGDRGQPMSDCLFDYVYNEPTKFLTTVLFENDND